MKTIGPTFTTELLAAGIDTNGISWGSDGSIYFADGAPESVIDAVDAVYAAHDPAPLSYLKSEKAKQINAAASSVAASLVAGYPEFEMQTWPDQKAEVIAWNADNSSATPVIDAMASARGIDRQVYLQKTYMKVQYITAAGSYLVGTRQKYVDQVNAATSQQALDTIVPVFTLPAP